MNTQPIHQNLRQVRKSLGLSQSAFANLFGLSRNVINKYEMGQEPPAGVLVKICQQLGLNVEAMCTQHFEQVGLAGLKNAVPQNQLQAWLEVQEQRYEQANAQERSAQFKQLCLDYWLSLKAAGQVPGQG